jgi:HD-GYP domain-containing protein (c-di-GMP phosphodiesterase class II)
MGIADIFEALTASDRPYKKGMSLSQSLSIMGRMKDEGHIDPDLFDVFIKHRVYLDYANKFLQSEQIDI